MFATQAGCGGLVEMSGNECGRPIDSAARFGHKSVEHLPAMKYVRPYLEVAGASSGEDPLVHSCRIFQQKLPFPDLKQNWR